VAEAPVSLQPPVLGAVVGAAGPDAARAVAPAASSWLAPGVAALPGVEAAALVSPQRA
jgi:hypothetical protein